MVKKIRDASGHLPSRNRDWIPVRIQASCTRPSSSKLMKTVVCATTKSSNEAIERARVRLSESGWLRSRT